MITLQANISPVGAERVKILHGLVIAPHNPSAKGVESQADRSTHRRLHTIDTSQNLIT